MTSNHLTGPAAAPTLILTLGLYLVTAALLLGRGTFYIGGSIMTLGLILQLATNQLRLTLNPPLRLFLGVMALLFMQGIVTAHGLIGKSPYALLWSMLMAAGVSQLPIDAPRLERHTLAVSVMLLGFVAIHLHVGDSLLHKPEEGQSGLFSGIHYLAEYAVMTLPILLFLARQGRPLMRVLMILALAGDLWLLLESRSRPGYLAMLASAFVIVPFTAPRIRWRFAALLLAGIGALYFGRISDFAARLDDLAANFQRDERWEIWLEALHLQQRSSWLQWLFGHGLGQYGLDYQATAATHGIIFYLAPHNFVMEILYSHGLMGLAVIGFGYGGFLAHLASITRHQPAGVRQRFGLMLLSVATAQLVHGYFTIPFFSRDYLIPLGLLLGVSFVYGSSARSDG